MLEARSWPTVPETKFCAGTVYRTSIPVPMIADMNQQPLCTLPLKVIEETPTNIYVARSWDRGSHSEKEEPVPPALWRSGEYYPVVFAISRGVVSSIVI